MKYFAVFLLCFTGWLYGVDQTSELIKVGNDKFLRWYGHAGRTYFIQIADPNAPLNQWIWAPIIETGNDEDISYEVDGTSQKGFFRLQYTDVPTSDPDGDDFDGDGIFNINEITYYGTNPLASDTDNDGINDGDEITLYFTSPTDADTDTDGINDFDEIFIYETDPFWWDTDEDTLSDGDEILIHLTNPLEMDSDGDWMWDDYEIVNNLNPNNAADGLFDADGDGLANQLEFVFLDQNFDPFIVNNAALFPWYLETDLDGINTFIEFFTYFTNPRQHDTDGDGLNDAWEIAFGFNPKINNLLAGPANQNPNADPDSDGLTNSQESGLNTDPDDSDSDGDGVDDGVENTQGSNPNDPNDKLPPPNGTVAVNVYFGDHSGSHSEKYQVLLTPLEGDAGGVRKRTNRNYGDPQQDTFHLPKGAKYKVEIKYAGTNPKYRGTPKPDYDYTLEIDDNANCLVVDDPQNIMGIHDESNSFFAAGKNATLFVPLFEWVTPKASPVTVPNDSIGTDGQNEFTYDAASPGVLTIDLKVLVKPAGTAAVTDRHGVKFSDRCIYKLPTIPGSTFAWDAANPGGKSATSGERLIAKATYTTLPAVNTDFGLKQAELECDGNTVTLVKGDFEVFFDRDAINHPGGQVGSPNWYYYWLQLISGHNVFYGGVGAGPSAEVKGMTGWNYVTAPNKTQITLYDAVTGKFKSYGVGEEFSGIDRFMGTLKHEAQHVVQIGKADALLSTNGADSFRYGWSWNQAMHNHWKKGADAQWGLAAIDDEADGTLNNARLFPPFEPGNGDDESLDHATFVWWPKVWPLPVPNAAPHPIESEAVNISDQTHNEHLNARNDWGNPGKNHKTIDKYDD